MIHRASMRLSRWLSSALSSALLPALLPTLLLLGGVPAFAQAGSTAVAPAAGPAKVLRYSFRIAETGFDPVQISDLYSRNIAGNIFDAPYRYAFLARPVKMVTNTAVDLPETSPDYKTFTVRIRPGIFFADDPLFKGANKDGKRELTAADYVYSLKRHYDPRWKSPHYATIANHQIVGLEELRQAALKGGKFDYDREVEGIRAVDRYTIRYTLAAPSPRFPDSILTDVSSSGAVAREVVEAHADRIMEHPVGTGPFKLARWKRSSLIVLDRNPNYRDEYYAEEAPPGDVLAEAAVAKLKGKKLPMVDRVEVSIIEENQPKWLSFVNGEMEIVEQVPEDFTYVAIPNNKLAPNLEKKGVYMVRYLRNDASMSYFGMENPVVGGYTPEKVALRRAIAMAVDVDQEIRVVRRGQAIPAQAPVAPGLYGYDPAFRSEMGEFSRPRAKALLDLYGYVDRDGDGWREQPDGSPLTIEYATQPDDLSRQLITQWKKNMDAIGIRIVFKTAKWPENLKASRAGKLMMWGVAWSGGPDGEEFLILGYGPAKGQANHARFQLAAYDRVYEQQKRMPSGAERLALIDEAKRMLVTYMPYKAHVHRIWTDMAQPWVIGYHRNVFVRDWWRLIDIDTAELARRTQ